MNLIYVRPVQLGHMSPTSDRVSSRSLPMLGLIVAGLCRRYSRRPSQSPRSLRVNSPMMGDRLHRLDVQGMNQVAPDDQCSQAGVECHRPTDRLVSRADYALWTAQAIAKSAADLEPRRPIWTSMQLESFRFGKHSEPMKCKSCNAEISEAAAGASIFAMSFLPSGGSKPDRTRAIEIAERIGPLCRTCLATCEDLQTFTGLKARILQAVREEDGHLHLHGLTAAIGVDPRAATGAFQRAITALCDAGSVRLELDELGITRFWTVTT